MITVVIAPVSIIVACLEQKSDMKVIDLQWQKITNFLIKIIF